MPLVRVDMHEPLRDLRAQMSAAIHSALVDGWEMPADDLFQVFRLHEQGDLFYSRTFPDADRTDIVFIQILAFTGYSPEVKQRGATLVVERLEALGIKRDNILIALSENGDGDWLAPAQLALNETTGATTHESTDATTDATSVDRTGGLNACTLPGSSRFSEVNS